MKKILPLLILATLVTAAKADSISITFAKTNQVATPGGTLVFNGTITNLTNNTVYLNGDSFTLGGPRLLVIDQFLNTVPFSLAPGANSGLIELFDVTVPASPTAADSGAGSYVLTGGKDFNASDLLGSGSFGVTPQTPTSVPEIDPSLFASPLLLLAGGIAVFRGQRLRKIA